MRIMKYLNVRTTRRSEFVDITREVQKAVKDSGVDSGLCLVFVPHTTAAVTINEGADPAVRADITEYLSKIVPHADGYRHAEGNSDSHIKASIIGASELVAVENGKLVLGTWQSLYFCEFDGPRSRKVGVRLI